MKEFVNKLNNKSSIFLILAISEVLLIGILLSNKFPVKSEFSVELASSLSLVNESILLNSANAKFEEITTNQKITVSENKIYDKYLQIPSISVNAGIVPLGINSNGEMDVPTSASEVAWYNLGPTPGEVGSAVITGHYDSKYNTQAVFWDLQKLKVGDHILVKELNGKTTTFAVRMIKRYSQDSNASEVFISKDGKAHLNLITCTGDWDSVQGRYRERLVVFSDKIN